VEVEKHLGFPHNLHRCHLLENLGDGGVGHVSLSGGSQAAVEGYTEVLGVRML
jgi:hypothetical protein